VVEKPLPNSELFDAIPGSLYSHLRCLPIGTFQTRAGSARSAQSGVGRLAVQVFRLFSGPLLCACFCQIICSQKNSYLDLTLVINPAKSWSGDSKLFEKFPDMPMTTARFLHTHIAQL
jgi:hypothetical protein